MRNGTEAISESGAIVNKTAYIVALCRIVGVTLNEIACDAECISDDDLQDIPGNTPDALWALIHATSEQRTCASAEAQSPRRQMHYDYKSGFAYEERL